MSTWLYLECLDHTPPLLAEDESGQHLYDLPQIRADIASRDRIVANVADDIWADESYRRNTARFLAKHPKCRIGVRDEYDVEHPVTEESHP
ncbi:MAG TPA: hypothetical protein VIO38_09625 [Rariglobus sp.]